jgi:hypothetical protein
LIALWCVTRSTEAQAALIGQSDLFIAAHALALDASPLTVFSGGQLHAAQCQFRIAWNFFIYL